MSRWGGNIQPSALTPGANPLLTTPSYCWLVEILVANSLPLNLTTDLTGAPLRFSTRDLYPTSFGVLFEKRLRSQPELTLAEPDAFGGQVEVQQFTLSLQIRQVESAQAPDLMVYFGSGEPRGWLIYLHRYDVNTDTVTLNVVTAEIAAVSDDDMTLSLACAALAPNYVSDTFPFFQINTSDHPFAPTTLPPTGGLGNIVPHGWGVNRGLPGRYARARNDTDNSIRLVMTADAATNLCRSDDHHLQTGQGPYHVTSDTTLPGGVAASQDYWVTVVDADHFGLCTTQANAILGTLVDITSAGTGTIVLEGGLGPNFADAYDAIFLSGNLSIEAVRIGGLPLLRTDYEVIKREYRQGGRYETAIRLSHEPRVGTGGLVSIIADGQRILPDVDDATLSQWDFFQGFTDDIGGGDFQPVAGYAIDSGSLVNGPSGWGLGGLDLFDTQLESIGAPALYAQQTFRLYCWFYPRSGNINGGTGWATIVAGPRSDTAHSLGWALQWQPLDNSIRCLISTAADPTVTNTTWTQQAVKTAAQTAPANRWHLAYVEVSPTLISVAVDSLATVATFNHAAQPYVQYARRLQEPTVYANSLVIGGEKPAGHTLNIDCILGPLWPKKGPAVSQAREFNRAWFLMRRNVVECLRDAYELLGATCDPTSWDTAVTVVDQIQQGALHCDGCFAEAVNVDGSGGLLDLFRIFVGMRLTRTVDGRLAIDIDQALAATAAAFSVYAPWQNISVVQSVARASSAEAVRSFRLGFRPMRDDSGRLITYQLVTGSRTVTGIGQAPDPVPTQLVHDPLTADVIAHRRANLLKDDDGLVTLSLGHEAVQLMPGAGCQVTLRDGTAYDYRLRQTTQRAASCDVLLTPYSSVPYTYQPATLAADPNSPPGPVVPSGTLAMTIAQSGGAVSLTVSGSNTTTFHVVRPDVSFGGITYVGGTTAPAVLNDVVADDDVTYVAVPIGALQTYWMAGAPLNVDWPILFVQYNVRGRSESGIPTRLYFLAFNATLPRHIGGADALGLNLTNLYANLTWSETLNNGSPWAPTDFAQDTGWSFGFGSATGDNIRITQFSITIVQGLPSIPGFFSTMRIWRQVADAITGLAPVDVPSELDPPLASQPSLTFVDVVASGHYYYTARIYDIYGRKFGEVLQRGVVVP